MKYRSLGTSESEVSEIGFGAWGIGGKEWQGSGDDESLKALSRAFELGVNLVDTALAYGDGHSEQLVGMALKRAYSQIFVATKIPPKNRVWPASAHTPIDEVFPFRHIIESTEQSLRNLGLEQIYLQQFHVWTDAWTQTEEWRRAVEDLRSSGKVRYMGISINDHEPDSALEAIKTGLFSSVQVIYNIFDQSAETNLFPLCQKLKIGVLVRVPLDEGSLTGTISPDTVFRPGEFREAYFRGDRKQQVAAHVNALKEDLKDVPGTLAEIALGFCLSQKAVTAVIPGMRRVTTVESSCRVSSAGALDAATLAILKRHQWRKNFYE